MTGWALTIWLSVAGSTVDVGGHLALGALPPILQEVDDGLMVYDYGLTLPHLSILSSSSEELLRHEQAHLRQWDALGPALPIAYVLTLGRPFEDYLDPDAHMWEPPRSVRRSCPLVRIAERVDFMPCWRF